MPRVLLLLPATSYRAKDFLDAARRLGVDVVVGSNHRQVLEPFSSGRSLSLGFEPNEQNISRIVAHARPYPVAAVVGTDEETTMLAAVASAALGLPHNSIKSVEAAHNKYRFRCVLAQAGIRSPWFRLVSLYDDLSETAKSLAYPCILKPLNLSASRGVIRADNEIAFLAACRRIAAILQQVPGATDAGHKNSILIERYIPGREVSLEGLLKDGNLNVLALFDKPDPLDGPFFEETLYVTPSRLSDGNQQEIFAETARAAGALGLRDGPIHAELRLNNTGAWVIELAARSIGGLCSRALSFAGDVKLEEVILRHALGFPEADLKREDRASGVMMIPIPAAGQLRSITGLEAARSCPGIDDVIISAHFGDWLVPLPEGDRYLGFIFAHAGKPDEVERALRTAHGRLDFEIAPAHASENKKVQL